MRFQQLTQAGASFCAMTTFVAIIFLGSTPIDAQLAGSDNSQRVNDHLQFGEFAKAIEIAETLSGELADQAYATIAKAQMNAGTISAATNSIDRIERDTVRFKALFQVFGGPIGAGGPVGADDPSGANVSGQAGGVTEADFLPLINLIQSTIDPDSWQDVNGDGTIQAYPAGVYVDSSGTLQKLRIDKNKSLKKLAQYSDVDSGNRFSKRDSVFRKISLKRLEKQAQLLGAQGKPVTEEMQNLAGIYQIQYLMMLPDSNDIVICGPAGNWQTDIDGHALNVKTGKPVLQLDDLVVCLRNAQRAPLGNNGKFGCSITPRKQNLADTQQFVSTSKLTGNSWRTKLRETLGMQDIEVFGIDPATHAGRVLVEADYRMKLVAMGLEPTIPEIPSYLSRLNVGPNGEVEPMDVVRWWFTMNYDEIVTDEDHNIFTFNGTGVKVLSENEFIDQQGERIHTGKSDGPTTGFARDFTRNFEKIADEYPVYRRLKNIFDLSIVSTLIRRHDLDHQANWNLTYFGNESEYADFVYQPATTATPRQVDSVMNHRLITRRQKSSTVKHTLVGVSGGITFDAVQVLNSRSHVADEPDTLNTVLTETDDGFEADKWWWD